MAASSDRFVPHAGENDRLDDNNRCHSLGELVPHNQQKSDSGDARGGSSRKKFGVLPMDETRQRMRKAGVADDGLAWVDKCLEAPARNVRGGFGNVRSEYHSPKMGFSIQAESHSVERVIALGLEWNSGVIGYLDQPQPLDGIFRKNGRCIGRRPVILDYVYVLENGECWVIECKSEEELDQHLLEEPHLYARNSEGVAQYLPVLEAVAGFGIRHRVVTPEEVGPMAVRNLECLAGYRNISVSAADATKIRDAVGKRPYTIVEVAARAGVTVDTVLASICHGDVYVDLKRFPVAETEHTLVHRELWSMPAYAEVERVAPMVLNAIPPMCRGTCLSWDGSAWSVVQRGETKTFVQSDPDGSVTEMTNGDFDVLVAKGTISVVTEELKEDGVAAIGDVLQQFCGDEGDQKGDRVLRKLEMIRQVSSGELSIPGAADRLGVSVRTIYNYCNAYQNSGDAPGSQFLSQVSYLRPPREKVFTDAHRRMENAILTDYFRRGRMSKPRRSVRRAYALYARSERKKGRTPFSRTTYRTRIQDLTTARMLLHRDGPRAANAALPSAGLSSGRLGDWPLHRVQFDGTVMDAVIRWYEEQLAGTPWPDRPRMLIAVDGYSRAVLAWYICFLAESGEMTLLVVRDLVKRHHRVPDVSYFDNGSGFISGALRRLLVGVCKREIAFRPPNQPKFSGQVERVFKEHQDQLLRNLAGYTGRLRSRRMVTKNFNPRKDAIWSLDGLIQLTDAFFALYNDSVHTEIGMTPNEALAEGWRLRGLRVDQRFAYDEQFRRATMPATSKTYTLDPRRGFSFRGNRYRNPDVCEQFTGRPKKEREFHLHFDPDDPAEIYVRIRGQMHTFRSDLADRLDALQVPGDRALVGKALPIERRDARRAERAGNDRLTDLLAAIEDKQEAVARARRKALDRSSSGLSKPGADGRIADGIGPTEDVSDESEHPLAYLDEAGSNAGEEDNV